MNTKLFPGQLAMSATAGEGAEGRMCPALHTTWPVFYQQGKGAPKEGDQAVSGTHMCWYGLEQLPDVVGKPEIGRLAHVEAAERPGDLDMQTAMLFPLAFFQALFTHKCVYTGLTGSLKSGCARYCNATVKVRSVCGWGLTQATRAHTEALGLGSATATLLGPRFHAVTFACGHVFLQGKQRTESLCGRQVTPFPVSTPPTVPYGSSRRAHALHSPHSHPCL